MRYLKKGHIRPTVCLDPGHDKAKYNRSRVVPEYYEGQQMWELSCLLKEKLEGLGIRVITTKSRADQKVSLSSRGKKGKNAELLISLHSNAASTGEPDWVTVLHQQPEQSEAAARSEEFAQVIGEGVSALLGRKRKIKTRKSAHDRDGDGILDDYYGVLRSACAVGTPAVILEHGFHTNESCARWLLDRNNLEKLAQLEAQIVADWFSMGSYTREDFIRRVQNAIGATVDGIAGKNTFSKTVTLSAKKNCRHKAVAPVQEWLAHLGYPVGEIDGFAGKQFTAAVKAFQKDNGIGPDGEITKKKQTWRCLLGMED